MSFFWDEWWGTTCRDVKRGTVETDKEKDLEPFYRGRLPNADVPIQATKMRPQRHPRSSITIPAKTTAFSFYIRITQSVKELHFLSRRRVESERNHDQVVNEQVSRVCRSGSCRTKAAATVPTFPKARQGSRIRQTYL